MAVSNARAYEHERRRAMALAVINRAKRAFFSNVSHEFRTPVALMLGPIDDALAAADLPPELATWLEAICQRIAAMQADCRVSQERRQRHDFQAVHRGGNGFVTYDRNPLRVRASTTTLRLDNTAVLPHRRSQATSIRQ